MKTIEERLSALESIVQSLLPVDISGDKYADFTVRRSPPQWLEQGGRDYTGENISRTSPEFCDAIASYLDWTAQKDEEKNYSYVNGKGETVFPAKYARKDASRARAWAVKLRAKPAAAQQMDRQIAQSTKRGPTQQYLGPQDDGSDLPF